MRSVNDVRVIPAHMTDPGGQLVIAGGMQFSRGIRVSKTAVPLIFPFRQVASEANIVSRLSSKSYHGRWERR